MARRRFRFDSALGKLVEITAEDHHYHYVQNDLAPYRNVIDGTVIEGRAQHEEFLARHGVEVYDGPVNPAVEKKRADPQQRREQIWEEVDRALRQGKRYKGNHPHNRGGGKDGWH